MFCVDAVHQFNATSCQKELKFSSFVKLCISRQEKEKHNKWKRKLNNYRAASDAGIAQRDDVLGILFPGASISALSLFSDWGCRSVQTEVSKAFFSGFEKCWATRAVDIACIGVMGAQYLAGLRYVSQVELLVDVHRGTQASKWDQQYF